MIRRLSREVGAAILAVMTAIPVMVSAADPEMRACWISRFDWASGVVSDPDTARARIQTIMQTLKDNNFNVALFQVRGECDALYPNPFEPWSPQADWTDPGYDPLSYAIQEAHARGIQLHAYINTHTMASTLPPSITTPQHIYNLYGAPGTTPNWQIAGMDGQPAGLVDGYYWLSPGIPQAEAWTRQAILYVVKNYDVDGIHFDRIRTPASTYSHDPISQARFEGEGNPDGQEWGDWMRSQITRQLRNIYGAVNQVKPHVRITAAPFGICKKEPGGYQGSGTESYYSWYQDSFGWMENHVVDGIFPMIYWNIGSAHPFEVLLADFLNHTGGRHVYAGSTSSTDYIAQVYETRRQGAPGSAIFSYSTIDWNSYLTGPYTEPAAVPEMPWKVNPTTGIIVGFVRDSLGNPVVDAHLRRLGDGYTYLSSGDGFYSMMEVPPGSHQLTAVKNNVGQLSKSAVVGAGQVVQIDFIFSNSQGLMQLDKSEYLPGQSMVVTLKDGDLKGEPVAQVQVVSSTETTTEVLDLFPASSSSTDTFTGAIPLKKGPPIPDGNLQVSSGDEISVVYHDLFDGTGPSIVKASALVINDSFTTMIIDNDEPGFTYVGTWGTSTQGNRYGATKRYSAKGDGSRTCTWTFSVIPAGRYRLDFWINNNNYASDAEYFIVHDQAPMGGERVMKSQNYLPDGWQYLGEFNFSSGTAQITITNYFQGVGLYVVADAMRLSPASSVNSTNTGWILY